MRILFLGDIVGDPGRVVFQKHIANLKNTLGIDALVVNGENSAGNARGITSRGVRFFKHHGVNVITSGNHIWHHKEIYSYLEQHDDLLRPANYPTGCPGKGFTIFHCHNHPIAIINLQGRTFMRDMVECPFRYAESLIMYLKEKTSTIFIDFHAEATSEKVALGFFLDGKITGLVGTHTHIQTADERVLPGGTAYISDLGMTGALNSSLGVQKEQIIQNFLNQMPVKFVVEQQGPFIMTGVWIEFDPLTGKATDIQRVSLLDRDLNIIGQKDLLDDQEIF